MRRRRRVPAGVPRRTRPVRLLQGHANRVMCLAISPSEEILASGGLDRTIRFWDLAKGKQMMAWPVPNTPTSLAYGADGSTLSWADDETFGFRWRSIQGNASETHYHEHAGEVSKVLLDPRDRFLTASLDGTIKLWGAYPRACENSQSPGTMAMPSMPPLRRNRWAWFAPAAATAPSESGQ